MSEGIFLSEQVVFILAKLVEGQQLHAPGTSFLETLDESFGIGKAVVIAGDDGEARQDIFSLLDGGFHIF